ncbi:MAG TPA: type IV pilus twitching motility protein PilT [Negativicutes bacterium]|nr:type IV pilus twitching motility protein PilT [Negativicutes bacterium]
MEIRTYLEMAVKRNASDLHLTVGKPPILRLDGELTVVSDTSLRPEDTEAMVRELLQEPRFSELEKRGELDFNYSIGRMGRFRVNAYKQRGSYGLALRVVYGSIPGLDELGLPAVVAELARKQRGLILVTGPTGSGKSTTLASMVDLINTERSCHIITLEDPIEYLHSHKRSIVNQREVGNDTKSFANGLRAALREDPDVILVGEMRDLETIATAITAAETGHLVLSTLHTNGAANTVDRIIDVFPPHQQGQVKVQLSGVLNGIISQQLLIKSGVSGRVGAFEVMISTNAIRNLIREGKTHQIQSNIQTGGKFGMQTMDKALLDLYHKGMISRDSALTYSFDYDFIKTQL